jgi:hypothetical protein
MATSLAKREAKAAMPPPPPPVGPALGLVTHSSVAIAAAAAAQRKVAKPAQAPVGPAQGLKSAAFLRDGKCSGCAAALEKKGWGAHKCAWKK